MSANLASPDIITGIGDGLVAAAAPATARFTGATIDSRHVQPGDLFFAIHGERQDGHDFVESALSAGAAGAVVSRPFAAAPDKAVYHVTDTPAALQSLAANWRSRFDMPVIAVTGSVGKTTAKEIIASVLSSRFNTLKTEANLNTEIGVPLTLLSLTPEHQRAVLELAMYQPGDIRLLAHIARPQVGIVLNVGPVHLERAGSIGRITAAKAELVEALPASGVAVLNADDPRVAAMSRRTAARVVMFGQSERADYRALDVRGRGLDGFSFTLALPDGTRHALDLRLPGKHHVHAVLAAIVAAVETGMALGDVLDALREVRLDLRLTVRPGPNGCTLIDDSYNASPASMIAALDLLSETGGRRIAILGHMRELGTAEHEGHVSVGKHAAGTCDTLIVVGSDASVIAQAAAVAGLADIQECATPEEAAERVQQLARSGDHVLVKASRAVGLESLVRELVEA